MREKLRREFREAGWELAYTSKQGHEIYRRGKYDVAVLPPTVRDQSHYKETRRRAGL